MDSRIKCENDENKMTQNDEKKTRAEIRAEILAHKKAIQSLTSQLSTTPERKALAKKLQEIRAEYAPDKALDAAANNKTVQELRKRVKDAGGR